jgi:hypothetical protein
MKLQRGDILQLQTSRGHAYVQFVGKHRSYGDTIAVPPRIFEVPQRPTSVLFEDSYLAFYPASAAIRESLASVVGNDEPRHSVPIQTRRDAWPLGSRVDTWIIEDSAGDERRTKNLSPAELSLPIGSIWSHDFLLARMRTHWRPDRIDAWPPAELDPEATLDRAESESATVRHFLVFDQLDAAIEAANDLRRRGWAVSLDTTSAEDQTIVITSGDTDSADVAILEDIAHARGGGYDGLEQVVGDN